MNYHNITHDDMQNGEGLRTVLWVAGCSHHCKGCQNPSTWDPEGGIYFDEDAWNELFDALDKDYCSGLTLSGGDPLHPFNMMMVSNIVEQFRLRYKFGNKTIWVYTGYTMDELKERRKRESALLSYILENVDVIVDGPYIEEQRNIHRLWCGSENQRIWRRMTSGWIADAPEYEKSLNELNIDEQHVKECGCE